MKIRIFTSVIVLISCFSYGKAQTVNLNKVFADAEKQTRLMLAEIPKAKATGSGATIGVTPGSAGQELVSPRTLDSSKLRLVSSRDWTSGFFPGELWFLYEYTGKKEWKTEAEKYTAKIEREKTNAGTHDMGFKVYCSFGTGYRLTKDAHYKEVIVESARTLATRFNPNAGVIKSWDNRTKWKYPVIIDNMMNLELLFAATQLTGDSSFHKIAVSHANTTMKNHFRSDYSSYHVLDYDSITGQVTQKTTHQGYANESAWSRGQAWGLYGYTMCYRFTKDKKYLLQAEKIAAYMTKHKNFPKDFVPYYDYDAPGIPNEPRDASAAAVMASALYELSLYSKNGVSYKKIADAVMINLTNSYRSAIGENRGFILLHSTGSKPSNSEVDVPLSYADYYYLEALVRSKKLKEKKDLTGIPKTKPEAGRTVAVSSVAELQTAIDDAKPGDKIVLKKGVYSTSADILISKAGTKEQPITIAADQSGNTELTGSGGFNLQSGAAYIIIKGFKFTHAASKARCSAGSSFCQWTNNIFETPGTGDYLTIAGSDHEIQYNTFQNKDSLGKFIAVKGVGSQIAERLWIHHNYFKKQKNQRNRNGAEALQFGLSGFSLSSSNSIVEHNLFEDCDGENELISVKASRVTVRYNTIRNCPAQFTLRHGNFNQVYGNYFINTPGLRIFGDDHLIHSNHFENCSIGINIGNGGAEVADGAPLTSHDRPDRVIIAFNTLMNNKTNIAQTARANGLGSTFITIANNIIVGGGAAVSIVGPASNHSAEGNIIFNTAGAGELTAGSFSIIDPKLLRDARGEYHLQNGSPAIDAAKGNYTAVIVDMDAQQRKGKLDVGADELSAAPVKSRILQPADVVFFAGRKY